MNIFRVVAEHWESKEQKVFWYNNVNSSISENREELAAALPAQEAFGIDKMNPISKNEIRVLKIQMGLACNYSCSYCVQREHAHPHARQAQDVSVILKLIQDSLDVTKVQRVEFWGGEPLVYLKTLKPLAEQLRKIMPEAVFGIITNGSLMTKEIADWLYDMGFGVGMSHDGPGQHLRGADPLDRKYEVIDYLIGKFLPEGRFSFNSMLNRQNISRMQVINFFKLKFPQHDFNSFGEMFFVDPYNEGSMDAIGFTTEGFIEVRRRNWLEIKANLEIADKVSSVRMAISAYLEEKDRSKGGQKCGMDRTDSLAVDMTGNVLTCQNVPFDSKAPNGESHGVGHLKKLEEVKVNTGTHWSRRADCSSCPVLPSCRGSCMFLQEEGFKAACETMYNSHLPMFALAFEMKTGYVPVFIDADWLPESRRDVWGQGVESVREKNRVIEQSIE